MAAHVSHHLLQVEFLNMLTYYSILWYGEQKKFYALAPRGDPQLVDNKFWLQYCRKSYVLPKPQTCKTMHNSNYEISQRETSGWVMP
jgi:hypothetical protein